MSDLLRFAALHLEDPSLAPLRAVHGEVAIHAWLDAWCLGWARFDWDGGPVFGWDGLINGERSVLRIMPDHRAAVALLTNSSNGRAMYRSLFTEIMRSAFGITVPPLRLIPSDNAPGDLSPYAGVYGWPDRQIQVAVAGSNLPIKSESGETEARSIDGQVFVIDPDDPDTPTVTFGALDAAGRPTVLYDMLWGLPRLCEWKRQTRDHAADSRVTGPTTKMGPFSPSNRPQIGADSHGAGIGAKFRGFLLR